MLFFNNAANCREVQIPDQIEKHLNISLYYYKSGVGNLGLDDLYVKRDDARNAIYSHSKGVVAGSISQDLNETQVLKIKKRGNDISVEYCDSIDFKAQDFYVIFSKDDIYVLDFFNRKFGKYFRTIMQYAEHCK